FGKNDSALAGDGPHARFLARISDLDPRSAILRMARVEYINGNPQFNRWLERLGVQHLGSKVGELRGLFEADGIDVLSVRTDSRIGSHHSIDVGPNLNAFHSKTFSQNGSGQVRAAAS